jgi:hypothetical protein
VCTGSKISVNAFLTLTLGSENSTIQNSSSNVVS